MKPLTPFQLKVKRLMDDGFDKSRDIADELNAREGTVSKAMDAVDRHQKSSSHLTAVIKTV